MLGDIKNAERKALLTVKPAGIHGNPYFTITEGETKSFGAFLDRLTQAIEWQCGDEQARPYLVKSLVFSNAND